MNDSPEKPKRRRRKRRHHRHPFRRAWHKLRRSLPRLPRVPRVFRRWRRSSSRREHRRRSLDIVLWPWYVVQTTVRGGGRVLLRAFTRLGAAWRNRKRRHLLQGIPALLAFVLVLVTAVLVQRQGNKLVDKYRDTALRAFRAKDFSAARVYFERLMSLDGGEDSSRHDLALTLASLGEMDRATAIMASIAPLDGPGFGRAHLWLAKQTLQASGAGRSESQMQQAYAHLMRAKQSLPGVPEVDWSIAQYYVAVRRPEAAAPYLTEAAKQMPELQFELSLLHASLGQVDLAREASYRAHNYFRRLLATTPDDDDARLRWASVRMNLGDFEGAVRILREGLALRPEGPFQRALAAAFVTHYDRLSQQSADAGVPQLELLRIALKHDANCRDALLRLVEFGEGTEDEQKQAREMLESLLARGYATPFVHFVLGCKAWEAGETDSALFHLERAYKLDKELGPVANNLAWLLSHQESPDLERALTIIDSVLGRWPDVAQYRDTRGQILVKLERWNDALEDLERALPRMARDAPLHAALGQVYRRLGQVSLAQKHEELARNLESAEDR